MFDVLHYLDGHGRDPFQKWLDSLTDRQAKIAVIRRIGRTRAGLAGDHRPLREGIQELRIDVGKGYRVYFSYVGEAVILLKTEISLWR
jgi:putative addiction module killer protein